MRRFIEFISILLLAVCAMGQQLENKTFNNLTARGTFENEGVTSITTMTMVAGGDIRPSADSTTALNIAQQDGTDFVTFDTSNKAVILVGSYLDFGSLRNVSPGGQTIYSTEVAGAAYPYLERGNMVIEARKTAANPRDIVFMTGDTTALVRMVVDRVGNVGIGMAEPEHYNLQVVGDIWGNQFQSASIGNGYLQNLVPTSEVITGGFSGSTATLISGVAPNGADVYELAAGTSNPDGRISSVTQAALTEYTLSFWARLMAGLGTLDIDNDKQTITGDTIVTASWQRFAITYTVGAVAANKLDFNLLTGSTMQIWGVQVNAGSAPYPYLKTDGAAVSTATGFLTGINNDLFVDGNVGINTTAPLSELCVNGGVHVGGDSDAGDNNLLVDGTGDFDFITWNGQTRVTSKFTKTTDDTLTDVTGLSVALAAAKTYYFAANLFVDADIDGGYAVAISSTEAVAAIIYNIKSIGLTTQDITENERETSSGGSLISEGETGYFVEIVGTVSTTDATSLTVKFSQAIEDGQSSVLVGSTFIVNNIQ